jgi:two-component system heavy metal sensor histidine kinase CusS
MNTATVTKVHCTYSIGRRLSLLLAAQTVIGLGVLLAVIYGITAMLFQAKHEEQMQGYTHVLADMMSSASERAGTFEMLDKLAWSAERRPGTHLAVTRADGSEFYCDPPASFDVEAAPPRPAAFW